MTYHNVDYIAKSRVTSTCICYQRGPVEGDSIPYHPLPFRPILIANTRTFPCAIHREMSIIWTSKRPSDQIQ